MYWRSLFIVALTVLGVRALAQVAQFQMPEWQEKGWCSYEWPPDLPAPPRINLPAWACEATYVGGLQQKFDPYTNINPFFISGDFDGDGTTDIAVWVKNKKNGKLGVLILIKSGKERFIAGAGSNHVERGEDFAGLDAWSMLRKGEFLDSVHEDGKVLLKGDAIILEKTESASFAIYWNGRAFAFYQVGD
jgi:hypothetical protein